MSNRLEKLNSEFRKYISELLTKKVKHPNLTEMFTILEVVCDKELATAKVYVSIFSTNEMRAAKTFFVCHDPYVRLHHRRAKDQLQFVVL